VGEWAAGELERLQSPYSSFYHPGLEYQVQPKADKGNWSDAPYPIRNPKIVDGEIRLNDRPFTFSPALVDAFGVSWWNYRTLRSEGCYLDFDAGHGPSGLTDAQIAEVDAYAAGLPCVMSCTSRGGRGRHWFAKIDLPAKNRKQHALNCRAAMCAMSRELGVDLSQYVCSVGAIQYILAFPSKIRLLKGATC
jgi:hypothetical protein